jgi:gamma-glutamyltranspeptidase/glutathione hydrolase
MLSSMCPTIVARDGKPVLITGSPGGRTIINTVLCVIVSRIDFQMDVRRAVDAPRLHHGWFPDTVRLEPALAEQQDILQGLQALGHTLVPTSRQGDAHSIGVDRDSDEITAAADTRIHGSAAGY